MNEMHEANRRSWNAASPGWQAGIDAKGKWREAATNPTVVLLQRELDALGTVSGTKICVLGSGDNVVVFALAGLGAQVTSVDISETQLEIAAGRARELELDVTFVRADVTDLSSLGDGIFDAVYTGGHVAVWVSDLRRYYSEAARILRSGGLFLINEYHPFRRLWKEAPGPLVVENAYFERGPFQYDRSGEVPGAEEGSQPSFEFHWTVGDFVEAVVGAGCEITELQEFGDEPESWEGADLRGLPQSLLIAGRKK